MKKIVYVLFLLVLIGGAGYFVFLNRQNYQSLIDSLHPCDKPIGYRIDSIDPKFNISRDKFAADVDAAAKIWSKHSFSTNKGGGGKLFVYDPAGKLSINLIYDQRQTENTKIYQLDKQLTVEKSTLNAQIADYKSQVSDLKKRFAKYESKVQSWNAQGGAPQDVFEQLNKDRSDLQVESSRLNDMANKLSLSSENYNFGVDKLKSAIGDFNEELTKKPEEGIFIGDQNRIEIYFNNNQQELVHTLAHEFGHALALAHVNGNSQAIMYPYTTKTITLSSEDIAELSEACRERSIWEVVSFRLNF